MSVAASLTTCLLPASPGAQWAASSTTDLLSELHPGTGEGLGACHFTKQLHGLSCAHLLVLGELDDLRGHGWGPREKVSEGEAAVHTGLLLLSHILEPSG